jgi:hypothetical protein
VPLIAQAREHMKAGRTRPAVALLGQHLETSPDDVRGLELLLKALAHEKDWSAARAPARRLTEIEPDDPRHWYALGVVLRRLQDFSEAEEALGRCLALEPTFKRAQKQLAGIARARSAAASAASSAAPAPAPTGGVPQRQTAGAHRTAVHTGKCPFCQHMVKVKAASVACPVCHTPHHRDCWEENGGCAVYACPGSGELRREEPAPPVPSLLNCPLCAGLLSPEALACPHCGHPMPEARRRAEQEAEYHALTQQMIKRALR